MVSKWTVIAVLLAAYLYYKSSSKKLIPNKQEGYYAPGWKKVVDLYRKHLDDGWQEGGAFSVYHKGKLVVEISGGYADERAGWEWTNKTVSQFFSTTKAVGAVVIAMLVDRGLLDYSTPISHYWPEFAQNGKKDITVLQLVSHQSGLSVIDEPYSYLDILNDNEKVSHIFAAQTPNWPPGKGHGYHTLSIGVYEDQIVRRVDPKHRSLSQFFHEEVAKPFSIEFYIGLPRDQHYRCARNTDKQFSYPIDFVRIYRMRKLLYDLIFQPDSMISKSVNNPPGMGRLDGSYNQPQYREVPNPSASGFGTAIGVAKFFGILANGGKHKGKQILSEKGIQLLSEIIVSGHDQVLRTETTFGRGVTVWKSPTGNNVFGAPGAGSQVGKCDPNSKLGIGYLTNHMTLSGMANDPKYLELEKAVYEALDEIELKTVRVIIEQQ